MRFFTHGTVPPDALESLEQQGHTIVRSLDDTATDAGEGLSADAFFKLLHVRQLDLITDDRDLVHRLRVVGARYDRSVVFLQLESVPAELLDEPEEFDDEGEELPATPGARAIHRLFARFKRLKPGHLYTVTSTQVKTQQIKRA